MSTDVMVRLALETELPDVRVVCGILSMPNAPPGGRIAKIEVLDQAGSSLGEVPKELAMGGHEYVHTVPVDPPMPVRITTCDGRSIDWITGGTPPEGFRLHIRGDTELCKKGFSGGHTRYAWEETMRVYGDLVRESSATKLAFCIPAYGLVEVTFVAYDIKTSAGWTPAKDPKSLFEGSDATAISAFEKYMIPYVAATLYNVAGVRSFNVNVPVQGMQGSDTVVVVRMTRNLPASGDNVGQITSWWLSKSNLGNPILVRSHGQSPTTKGI